MEIHKPKPFHDWHEFLSEILIIVIGVLIAMSAEQAIEAYHWHHKIETVEEAMRAELVDDDLPQAYTRIAIAHCLSGQLDTLQAMARPGVDGARFAAAAQDYIPPYRTWDTYALAMAQQSDISAHMSAVRMSGWTLAYSLMPPTGRLQERESDLLDRLRHSRFRNRPLTQADADDLNDVIDDLRSVNRGMLGGSKVILDSAERGPKLTVKEATRKGILAEARHAFGNCVVEPKWALPSDQQIVTKQDRQFVGS